MPPPILENDGYLYIYIINIHIYIYYIYTYIYHIYYIDVDLPPYLVGGFNHLEKHESQWEELSHICILYMPWYEDVQLDRYPLVN